MVKSIEAAAAAYTVTRNDRNIRCARLSAEFISLLRGSIPAQTQECVSDRLGISGNTWVKIKRGHPILESTAERLVARLEIV